LSGGDTLDRKLPLSWPGGLIICVFCGRPRGRSNLKTHRESEMKTSTAVKLIVLVALCVCSSLVTSTVVGQLRSPKRIKKTIAATPTAEQAQGETIELKRIVDPATLKMLKAKRAQAVAGGTSVVSGFALQSA